MVVRNHSELQRHGGNVLVILAIVIVAVGTMIAGLTTMTQSSSKVVNEAEKNVRCEYLAFTGLQRAFAEVGRQDDVTGHGLGAMGLDVPIVYTDSTGNPAGEFMTVVMQQGTSNIILSVAGVPDLSNPDVTAAAEAVIETEQSFLLRPKPAAIAISGPIEFPTFPGLGDNDVLIDGGVYPALSLSHVDTFTRVMNEFGSAIHDGYLTEDELNGGLTSTYDHPTAGEIDLPIWQQDFTSLSAEALNTYRQKLRDGVLALAENADRTVSSTVKGDQTWGSTNAPEITVIEAGDIGSDNVFGSDGQTVTGSGSLIVKHTLRPGKDGTNLNLNWDGDVFVVGFDGDGSDLLYLHGTRATINGNLILLSSDNTEASLEARDSNGRPSDLTVNGALLTLAEAASHESEVEVEGSSSITVNGLLGLYGSRIELEASSSNTSLTVNGTLAVGMAQDVDPDVARNDDFEFQMDGAVSIVYDKDLVSSASDRLADLQMELFDSSDTNVYDLKLSG